MRRPASPRPHGPVAPRRPALLVALCLPLLLGGCLDYDEVLTLNRDGGGSLEAELTIDTGLLRALSVALGRGPAPEDLAGPTRDEVLDALSVEGVTVRSLHVEPQGPRTWIRLAVDFTDLEALHRLEGFGARRRLELYDHGDGRVLVVSRFDPREVVPLPELAARWAEEDAPGPRRTAAVEAVLRDLRRATRLRAELRLPGPVLASNGHPDAAPRGVDASAWSVDAGRNPARHDRLGGDEVLMKVLCDRSAVPWARDLAPTPPEAGRVDDDALGPHAAASTSPALSASPDGLPGPARGRGGAGCALAPASPRPGSTPAPGGVALLVAGLLLARRAAGARAPR